MHAIVIGASDRLGRLTAEAVLADRQATGLVLVTARPDRLHDLASRGAIVRYGALSEPDELEEAFAGADRLLLTGTEGANRAAVDAAVFAGIRTVGYVSTINPSHSNPLSTAAVHRETEEYIRTSGLDWTFLRSAIHTETLLPVARCALASGRHVFNGSRGATGYVSRADCAAVGAAFLTSPDERHARMTYDLTGPEALTGEEVAHAIGLLGGLPITATPVDDTSWVASAVRHTGLPQERVWQWATQGVAARGGYTAAVSSTVRDLTGRPPRALPEVLGQLLRLVAGVRRDGGESGSGGARPGDRRGEPHLER
ncbi:NAD(P)H-binding protein [Streptomyces cyaneofuscatus]|uniref:NAD(P)H-binding protein n=1 Tax=Streptomyces cyaneofuscatus TaxID=66883 RepID=UPI00381021B9